VPCAYARCASLARTNFKFSSPEENLLELESCFCEVGSNCTVCLSLGCGKGFDGMRGLVSRLEFLEKGWFCSCTLVSTQGLVS
jgi:hypothetical protein